MSRALAITQRQAQTLLRAAEAERAIVEVKVGETVIRLIPECHTQDRQPIDDGGTPDTFQSLDDYLAWRQRSRAGAD